MIKQKLKNFREKKFTQEEFAFKIGMETSNYNRRENGINKISKREWDKMAKALEVPLEEIYDPEDGVYIFHTENATGNVGNYNIFNTLSEYAVETMKKYITKLEDEIQDLKEGNKLLKK